MDVAAVVQSVAELYRPAAEDKNLDFNVTQPREALMHGDPSLVAQAIGNLLDNAIKYTQPGGHIELSIAISPRREGLQIVVSDSGPGIEEAERSRVTARFYRGNSVQTVTGTGLGLSMVSAIATLHGGELLLQDNRPGLRATLLLAGNIRDLTEGSA